MRIIVKIFIFILILFCLGCEKTSKNAVTLSVDFSWEGINECGWGNPTIFIGDVPEHTKFIKIHMYDNEYNHDHGEVIIPFAGEKIIKNNRSEKIQGPCPPYQPGKYEVTIKALDENKVVIGKGNKVKPFPE